jgi:hypothetical protein
MNFKLSAILGGAGLVLSLAVGLVSRAGFPQVFIRAGVFGLVFFAIGSGLWLLINNFIPELLSTEAPAADESSDFGESRVNITLEDSKNLPEMYRHLDNDDDVGNIKDLVSGTFKPPETAPAAGGGMDQKPQAGYTEEESSNDGADGLPDIGSMAGSFLAGGTDESPAVELPERRQSGNKSQQLEGDFKPKELAAGIRTVLEKDK